jgi:hypothetical protein
MRMMNHANQHRGHALVTGASSGRCCDASRLLRDGWYVTGLIAPSRSSTAIPISAVDARFIRW